MRRSDQSDLPVKLLWHTQIVCIAVERLACLLFNGCIAAAGGVHKSGLLIRINKPINATLNVKGEKEKSMNTGRKVIVSDFEMCPIAPIEFEYYNVPNGKEK